MGVLSTVLKSRTVWGAAILGVIPVLQAISPIVPAGTKAGAAIAAILAIYTIYCRIKAKQPLGPVIDDTIAKTVDAVHRLQTTAPQPAPVVPSDTPMVKAMVKGSQ